MVRTMMSSSRGGDGLSLRLQSLKDFHTNQKNIWDIGCDHGQLGLSFATSSVESIHLVDPSKPVIDELHRKIKDSYITKSEINISKKEGQKLIIDRKSNCVFIAGMGGKEIGEIIIHLLPQLDETSRIVISPHRKILELRVLLHSLPLILKDEKVLFEEDQFYQVLCLIPGKGEKVSFYGEGLWQSKVGEEYRQHQIKFFSPHQDLASIKYLNHLKTLNPLKTTPK